MGRSLDDQQMRGFDDGGAWIPVCCHIGAKLHFILVRCLWTTPIYNSIVPESLPRTGGTLLPMWALPPCRNTQKPHPYLLLTFLPAGAVIVLYHGDSGHALHPNQSLYCPYYCFLSLPDQYRELTASESRNRKPVLLDYAADRVLNHSFQPSLSKKRRYHLKTVWEGRIRTGHSKWKRVNLAMVHQ